MEGHCIARPPQRTSGHGRSLAGIEKWTAQRQKDSAKNRCVSYTRNNTLRWKGWQMPGLAYGLGRLRGRVEGEAEAVHTPALARLPKKYRRLARVDNLLKFGDESKQRRAIVACGKDWRAALALLRGIDKGSVRLHVLGFNAAMRTCELADRWFSAVQLCEQMQHLGIRPNKYAHNVLVKACGVSGRWSGGVQILSNMCFLSPDPRASKQLAPQTPLLRPIRAAHRFECHGCRGCTPLTRRDLEEVMIPAEGRQVNLGDESYPLVRQVEKGAKGLPFLLPAGVAPKLDSFVDSGFYAVTVVSFIVLHIKSNLGSTMAATSSGLRGVVLAVCNAWCMFGLFPDGYTEEDAWKWRTISISGLIQQTTF
eukprot:s303_g38.t1